MQDDKTGIQKKTKLYEAILSQKTIEDYDLFYEDLCTINEINAMVQRLEVAELLKQGETFNTIVEKTGASTATISRVNKCLKYGAGGYDIVLK